ncbi:g1427 [Coccomyxa elongata]
MVFEVVSNTCGIPGPLQQPPRFHTLQAATCSKGHQCTRFCGFEHVFGNVFNCTSSGKTHICDSTCEERVQLDPHTSVCRLSKRVFSHAPVFEASRKRFLDDQPSCTGGDGKLSRLC